MPVKIAQLGAVWDSTNFPDGTNIVLKARVTLVDFPDPFEQQREALIYNKAYLVGNVSPQVVPGGLGDLTEGYDAVTAVAARLAGTHHTLNPAANDRCKQQKPDITSALPPNTLFYLWSHGELGSFGDSAAFVNDPGGPRFPVHWLNDGEVSSILTDQTSGKGTQYPPYNFVFIDACETGGGMAMAMAFGIGMDPDRALMGFAFQMDDTQHNVNWSNRVFQKLAEGYILSSAIEWANANGGKAKDANGVDRDPTIHGDLDFKLRGVYPLDQSLIWFR